jgi:hypothetical protein
MITKIIIVIIINLGNLDCNAIGVPTTAGCMRKLQRNTPNEISEYHRLARNLDGDTIKTKEKGVKEKKT